jgi:hypothetical protein
MKKMEIGGRWVCAHTQAPIGANPMNLLDKKLRLYIVNHLSNLWSNLGRLVINELIFDDY